MSAQRTSLSSKPVIAAVLCLLAVVAAINVVVFKPGGSRSQRAEIRVQAAPPVPFDLGELRQDTATPGTDLAAWATSATPTLQRDPFGNARTAAVASPQDAPVGAVAAKSGRLICNAILLGGGQPTALINGKTYRVGDQVGTHRVLAVGASGVRLVTATGQELQLSVSDDPDRTGRNRVVTEASQVGGLGGTSLVEHARGERK